MKEQEMSDPNEKLKELREYTKLAQDSFLFKLPPYSTFIETIQLYLNEIEECLKIG